MSWGGIPILSPTGELWVNKVRILGLTKVKNGVIFAIEDYLYADALAEHLDSNKKKKKEKENEVQKLGVLSLLHKSREFFWLGWHQSCELKGCID